MLLDRLIKNKFSQNTFLSIINALLTYLKLSIAKLECHVSCNFAVRLNFVKHFCIGMLFQIPYELTLTTAQY